MEIWNRRNRSIVKTYKYLGITLTPSLNLTLHFAEKDEHSKLLMNSIWSDFLGKQNICFQAKIYTFNAAVRASYIQGAEVWGFKYFKEVNKFQRYGLKRILNLPTFTPNYMLALETGLKDLSTYSLRLHMNYIIKTLFKYNESRLPNFLSNVLLRKRIFWVEDWCSLWPLENDTNWINCRRIIEVWKSKMNFVINWLGSSSLQAHERKALDSSHGLYKLLNHSTGVTYINNKTLCRGKISWIFKARAGLLSLNTVVQSRSVTERCELCNGGYTESLIHFFGSCVCFNAIRQKFFLKNQLTADELVELLNGGMSWRKLGEFTKEMFNHRDSSLLEMT